MLEQNLSQQFSKCRNLKKKKEKDTSFSSSNNARRKRKRKKILGRIYRDPADILKLAASAGRGRPFQLVCHIYVHCFYRGHGSSCEPEAAESSWRDITMSPLHSFRRRSPAFFCVFSPFSSGSTRTKYRGVARVCPADGSQVTCCY